MVLREVEIGEAWEEAADRCGEGVDVVDGKRGEDWHQVQDGGAQPRQRRAVQGAVRQGQPYGVKER